MDSDIELMLKRKTDIFKGKLLKIWPVEATYISW